MSRTQLIHPMIDAAQPARKGDPNKSSGILNCHCNQGDHVEVTLDSNVMFNHACGCSKCWKPSGALFSMVGVVPRDKLSVTENESKLQVVDKNAAIQRYACKDCGVHMLGRIESKDNPFYGLDFVHVELSPERGWQEPQFAAFVSSIIEQGHDPERMGEVRKQLKTAGLEPYDALSPDLMDLMATHTAKQAGTFKAKM